MKLLAVALVSASSLLLAACSTSGVAEPATTSSPTPTATTAPSAAEYWEQAIATTATAGGVSLEAQLVTNVEGFQRVELGEGYVHLPSASGDMLWTDDRSVLREIRVPSGHYVELDGTWYEESEDIPTTVAFTPLAGLDTATEIRAGVEEEVLGVPTRTFEATLAADARLMGVSTEELSVMDPTSGEMTATIWVDEELRIVRIVRDYRTTSLDGDPIEAQALFLLSDFGTDRPIEAPETADAIQAPA